MFESILANFLTSRAAQFVKHIPQEQLRVGVWRGEIVLDDLELRADCLDGLGLPVSLEAGYVGSLRISIPWSSLGSKPVVAEVERIHLILRLQVRCPLAGASMRNDRPPLPCPPIVLAAWLCWGTVMKYYRLIRVQPHPCVFQENPCGTSQDAAASAAEMSKQAAIMAAELAKRSNGSSSSSPGWLTSMLFNKVMGSLQVRVNDVHIRVEVDTVVSGGPAVGVGLVCQCMRSRHDKSVSGQPQQLLQVRGLSIYWDRDVEMTRVEEAGLAQVAELFDKWGCAGPPESLPSVHEDEDGDIFYVAPSDEGSLASVLHHWVLQPCDVDVSGSLLPADKSQYKLVVSVAAVPLVLEVGQMWDMFRLLDWLQVAGLRKRYGHLRPGARVLEDRRAWWAYAIAATVLDVARTRWRLRWADVRVHLGQRREYAQLYQLVLANRASAQDRAQLAFLESQVSTPCSPLPLALDHPPCRFAFATDAPHHTCQRCPGHSWRSTPLCLRGARPRCASLARRGSTGLRARRAGRGGRRVAGSAGACAGWPPTAPPLPRPPQVLPALAPSAKARATLVDVAARARHTRVALVLEATACSTATPCTCASRKSSKTSSIALANPRRQALVRITRGMAMATTIRSTSAAPTRTRTRGRAHKTTQPTEESKAWGRRRQEPAAAVAAARAARRRRWPGGKALPRPRARRNREARRHAEARMLRERAEGREGNTTCGG
jgi:hypothetical protein